MTFTYFKQTSPLFKDFPSSLIDNDEMLYLCWEKKKKKKEKLQLHHLF